MGTLQTRSLTLLDILAGLAVLAAPGTALGHPDLVAPPLYDASAVATGPVAHWLDRHPGWAAHMDSRFQTAHRLLGGRLDVGTVASASDAVDASEDILSRSSELLGEGVDVSQLSPALSEKH